MTEPEPRRYHTPTPLAVVAVAVPTAALYHDGTPYLLALAGGAVAGVVFLVAVGFFRAAFDDLRRKP